MSLIAATVFPARLWATKQAQRSVREWNGLNAWRGEYGKTTSRLATWPPVR